MLIMGFNSYYNSKSKYSNQTTKIIIKINLVKQVTETNGVFMRKNVVCFSLAI